MTFPKPGPCCRDEQWIYTVGSDCLSVATVPSCLSFKSPVPCMYQQVQSNFHFTIAYKVYSLLLHLFRLDDVIMKKMYV